MNKKQVIEGLLTLQAAYPGRINADEETALLWCQFMEGIDHNAFLAAVLHLSTSGGKWPPSVPEVRAQALQLMDGMIEPPSGVAAWENIWAHIRDPDNVQLTELETRASRSIGGTWAIKNSKNATFDRAQFIKTYDEMAREQRLKRLAHPAVNRYIEQKSPILDPPKAKRLSPPPEKKRIVNGKEPSKPTPEQVIKMCQSTIKGIDDIVAKKRGNIHD